MNITLSLFVDKFGDKYSAGAYFVSPITARHHFFGEVAANEESVIIAVLEKLSGKFDELGCIQFITTTTNYLNFLCKGKSRETAPSAAAVKACLKKINAIKGTKFKKNEAPSKDDVVALSRADMMNIQVQRFHDLTGDYSLYYEDKANMSELKKAYKKVPNIFLGSKLFHWGATESLKLKGDDFTIYYNGGFTPKSDTQKKDNNLDEFSKALRSRLYTYYTGSNSKLTDAGQRSLEEIRCITLVKEPHPIVEEYFKLQDKGVQHLPVTPVYTANLDKIIGGAASSRIMSGDEHWFNFNPDSGDLIFNGVTRTDISYVFYPQRLGPRIRNQFLALKDRFIRHLEGDPIGEEYDITDLLFSYDTNDKGKTTCNPAQILNGKFNILKIPKMSFDGANFTLRYVFDIDSPPARLLRGLAKLNPRVSIVFENLSDTTIGYYTIIRTDIGVSIYSCPEGSRLIRRKR